MRSRRRCGLWGAGGTGSARQPEAGHAAGPQAAAPTPPPSRWLSGIHRRCPLLPHALLPPLAAEPVRATTEAERACKLSQHDLHHNFDALTSQLVIHSLSSVHSKRNKKSSRPCACPHILLPRLKNLSNMHRHNGSEEIDAACGKALKSLAPESSLQRKPTWMVNTAGGGLL